MKISFRFSLIIVFVSFVFNTGSHAQINKEAKQFLKDSLMLPAHLGVYIYEPATGKEWMDHQSKKNFIPASNTKLFSLYAGLKYLGDSLPSARYIIDSGIVHLYPTGDPTFLHPDFKTHQLYDFLKANPAFKIVGTHWKTDALGYGWAWDDYNEYYMAQRSLMPVYGNITMLSWKDDSLTFSSYNNFKLSYSNKISETGIPLFTSSHRKSLPENFSVRRKWDENIYELQPSTRKFNSEEITMNMDDALVLDILKDTLKNFVPQQNKFTQNQNKPLNKNFILIRSQPSDSMFRRMMQRSDNFFAEQTLLMASNEKLGYLDEQKMIDTILKSDLKGLPQKPKWVDGSGLSRYNLFSPRAFVYLLNKMKDEYGLDRMKNILPTGGQGTLRTLYKKDSGYIFAKTGTLSNHLGLSGYLITRKNKLLVFSILVNSFPGEATPIRKRIEKFLSYIRERN